jgi:DNA-binding NarL/FixJ family response regulator
MMSTRTETLKVLAVTRRPAIATLLRRAAECGLQAGTPLDLVVVPTVLDVLQKELPGACDVAVVDVHEGIESALVDCATLRAAMPDLPIAAVLCCERVLSDWDQRRLAEHADTAVDLHASEAEILFALRGLTRAAGVRLGWAARARRAAGGPGARHALRFSRAAQRSGGGGLSEDDARLAALVAQGLSNRQLGEMLHMSRFGIDHRINRLCAGLRVRDRVELAAWAGAHGLYPPGRAGAPGANHTPAGTSTSSA